MPLYIDPVTGNPEVWDQKPDGYLNQEEWDALHPAVPSPFTSEEAARILAGKPYVGTP